MKSKLIGNEEAVKKAEAYVRGDGYGPLLISGEEGLGQEVFAMEIASELLKTDEPEKHGNFYALRPENGMIRVESVEEILDRSRISAHSGSKKVFGIFGIGCMTKQAQNRLLKLLEDRSDTNVVLMTQEGGIVLDTIVSRSVCIRLQRVPKQKMDVYLQELGAGKDLAVYEAVMRGCPYRYAAIKDRIGVFREIYHAQLEIRQKKQILYLFHEVKEKDKESFYEKRKQQLYDLLNMEFSLFEELLLWKEGAIVGFSDERYSNLDRLYGEKDVIRILQVILEQKRKLRNAGQYTRNDFVDLLRELCR